MPGENNIREYEEYVFIVGAEGKYPIIEGKLNLAGDFYYDNRHGPPVFTLRQLSDIIGLEHLEHLRELNLTNNDISDIWGFTRFKNLETLEKLILWGNHITEIKGLDRFANLRELDFQGNRLTAIGGLENLSALQILDLSSNHIEEIQGLSSLANLQVLDLNHNHITEIKGLEALSNLQKLDLSHNQAFCSYKDHLNSEGRAPNPIIKREFEGREIFKEEGLTELLGLIDIVHNRDRSESNHFHEGYRNAKRLDEIRGLECLTNLKELVIGNNKIRDIKGLETLCNLQKLDLSYNRITTLKGLEHLENLKYLLLSCNEIRDLEVIECLTSLTILRLSSNRITSLPDSLIKLPNLKRLHLKRNPLKEDAIVILNKLRERGIECYY
ncbi:MAG: leucine-rich repeat domain-containing protein [Candidatus Helarchaeota archaeon]|nr:leucine-rich repeat domain-containing protein [Candidatus Helarchaeota archaeon]